MEPELVLEWDTAKIATNAVADRIENKEDLGYGDLTDEQIEEQVNEDSHYEVHFDGDGYLGYDYQQCVEGSTTYTEFRCPRCREILFTAKDTQPQEVIDFLRE